MSKEIEKKFYVDISDLDLDKYDKTVITQNYLVAEGIYQLRIREMVNLSDLSIEHYLTYKMGNGLVREEKRIKIDQITYYELKDRIEEIPIKKDRYNIPYKGKVVELDVFYNDLSNVAEIEFNSIEELENFKFPNWFRVRCNKDNADFWREINNKKERITSF
mgnify:FL=1